MFWFGLGLWGLYHGSGWLVFVLSQNIIGLILFYSIPEMEARMTKNPKRREAFQEYQRTTSMFILLPPRQKMK